MSNQTRVIIQCGNCGHFRNDPAYLERLFVGLTSLSSAYGSARSGDGVCARHDRYLSAQASCDDFIDKAVLNSP